MASSLEEFLAIEPQEEVIETVPVTMKNGKVLEVDISGISPELFKHCKKTSTNTFDNPNGGVALAQVEEITFCQKLCSYGIVAPSLNNVQLRNKYNVHTNEELVLALFPIQTILEMGNRIAVLTLGDQIENIEISEGTDAEKVEEAKN